MSICNEALAACVRCRLALDYRTASQSIDVTCCDGHICLLGCVDTPEHRDLAAQLVSGVVGVRAVNDELRIRSSGECEPVVQGAQAGGVRD